MTVKRNDNTDEFEVKVGGQTVSWRVIVTILLLSGTPIGDRAWALFGLSTQQTIAQPIEQRLTHIETLVANTHKDVATVSRQVDVLEGQIAEAKSTFTGFKIDFEKYKKENARP